MEKRRNRKMKMTTKLALVLLFAFAMIISNIPANDFSVYADEDKETDVVVEEETEVVEEATPEPTTTPEIEEEVVEEPVETPEVTEEPQTVEEPKETEAPQEEKEEVKEEEKEEGKQEETSKEEKTEKEYAFNETKTIDDMAITVQADEGIFPGNTHLVVEKVPTKKEEKVTEAIDAVRDEEKNVAVSYSFDIRIEDENGNEVQPADQNKVKVSFALIENTNENLDTNVYHVSEAMKVEQLDVEVKDDIATVETTGFSIYTVEFTYDNKQYVLEGNAYIKLETLLEEINIKGEVSDYAVSDDTLFNIFLGDEKEIGYKETVEMINGEAHVTSEYADKEDGTVLYVAALKPFQTEEWLDVTIDDIVYRIIVTDDYQDDACEIHSVDGVVQGENETNFTKSMPLADIYINEDVVNMTPASRNNAIPQKLGIYVDYDEFQFLNPTRYQANDNVTLSLDVNKAASNGRPLHGGTNSPDGGGDTFYPGDIIQYTFVDGAMVVDKYSGVATNYDVVITYSNLHVTLDYPTEVYEGFRFGLFAGNMAMIGATRASGQGLTSEPARYGIKVDTTIKVVDKTTGQPVDGNFYYPMIDLDVNRMEGVSETNFGKFYNSSENKNYSEQVILKRGLAGDIYIPGGDFDCSQPKDGQTNMPYLAGIDQTAEGLRVYPNKKYNTDEFNSGRDQDYYTGFVTLVDNTNGGLTLSYLGSSASLNVGASASIETYLLSGKNPLNHLLVSTTGEGGTISTTRFGNHNGDLNDNSAVYKAEVGQKQSLTVATGQTVVYTMKPKEGYRIKEVKVNVGNRDINADGTTTITPIPVDTDSDGKPDYYTFGFVDVNQDGSIHVEWEPIQPKLKLTKQTVNNKTGTFNFEVVVTKEMETGSGTTPSSDTVGPNYKAHDDDLIMYRVDLTGYDFKWTDHNLGDFRAKNTRPGTNTAMTVGTARALGTIAQEFTANGEAMLRLNQAVTASDGSKKDIIIKYNSAKITPAAGKTVEANNTQLFHAQLNGAPAFSPGFANQGDSQYTDSVNPLLYTVLADAQIFVTNIGATTPLSGTFNLSFTEVGEVTNGGQEEVTVAGEVKTADAGTIALTADASGANVTMKSYGNGGVIYLLNGANPNTLTMSSGPNGKIQATTNGEWESDGSVSDEGMILNAGTYGLPDGKTVTFKLIPLEGYALDQVTVNGTDKAADVVEKNGFYFLTVENMSNDTDVHVTWKVGEGPHEQGTIETYYYNLTDGTYSTTPYTNTVQLSNGESKEWDFPYGWYYEITEVDPGAAWELQSYTNEKGTIEDIDVESVFTNKKKPGHAKVTKQWNDSRDFYGVRPNDLSVTITTDLGNTYTTQAGGWNKTNPDEWEYNFVLDDYDEKVTNIVEAVPNHYAVTYSDPENSNNQLVIENKLKTHSIEVVKVISAEDDDIDRTKEFEFTLSIPALAGKTIGMELNGSTGPQVTLDANGEYTFKLTHEDSARFIDILDGVSYKITENTDSSVGYTTSYIDVSSLRPQPGNETSGTSLEDDYIVIFINTLEYHSLEFNKTVSGSMGDKEERFNFTVTLKKGNNPYSLATLPTGVTGSDGTYTVKLGHGESIKLENIPYGVTYTVTEDDYTNDGYTTKVDDTDGREVANTLTGDASHTFENTRGGVIPTGVDYTPIADALFLVLIAMIGLFLFRKRKVVHE